MSRQAPPYHTLSLFVSGDLIGYWRRTAGVGSSSVTPAAGQQGQPGRPTILTGKWMSAILLCFLRLGMWFSGRVLSAVSPLTGGVTRPVWEAHFLQLWLEAGWFLTLGRLVQGPCIMVLIRKGLQWTDKTSPSLTSSSIITVATQHGNY